MSSDRCTLRVLRAQPLPHEAQIGNAKNAQSQAIREYPQPDSNR